MNWMFRGKRISNKEWVYGYIWIIPVVNLNYILTGKIDIRDCSIEKYEVDPSTVGIGVEIKGKWFYEGDICENPFVCDLWMVEFEDDCFKVGLIPNSGIIKHPDNAKYPLHTELLCDMAHTLKPFTTKWDNPELVEVGE
jgi:hypothetical protein